MSDEVVDFRKPARVAEDIAQMFGKWQESTRVEAELRWAECPFNSISFAAQSPLPRSGRELREMDSSSIAYKVEVEGLPQPSLLLVPNTLAVSLMMELMGEQPSEQGEDEEEQEAPVRPLTTIESTCLEYLVEQFVVALEDGQPLATRKKLTQAEVVKLKELHNEFPENGTNIEVGFRVSRESGEEVLKWILPQAVTLEFVAGFMSNGLHEGRVREQLENLISESHIQLEVRLGGIKLPIEQLSELKAGDVLTLDQRISEPFDAIVGGVPVFRGWGARVGHDQAFQIDNVMET